MAGRWIAWYAVRLYEGLSRCSRHAVWKANSMTIRYALTKAEILRVHIQSLSTSPRFLAMNLIYSCVVGLLLLAMSGAFSRSLTLRDGITALAWSAGAFLFVALWQFVRGKTDARTLTVSDKGISTEIGSLKGQVPWTKVRQVTDAGQYVVIVGAAGNALFIPARAFSGPDQQAQFITQIEDWRRTA
jgi:hypothetical protein